MMIKTGIALAFLMFICASCCPELIEIPPGVWQSDEPRITLYFMPEYRSSGDRYFFGVNLGFFLHDGVERRVHTDFGSVCSGSSFVLVDRDMHRELRLIYGDRTIFYEAVLISGRYRIVGNEMHYYDLWLPDNRRSALRTIVFRQVEDYMPIDPDEWRFQGLIEIPPGVWQSEEPMITLYFMPEYLKPTWTRTNRYLGYYFVDGYEKRVFTTYTPTGFRIHDLDLFNEHVLAHNTSFPESQHIPEFRQTRDSAILIGDHQIVGDEMHFTLTDEFRSLLGIETIIFRRIDAFSHIDLEEWFPEHLQELEDRQP